jgi:hypothetical protein
MSFGADERIQSRIIARKDLSGAKKTTCMISSDGETVIYPLPGYD